MYPATPHPPRYVDNLPGFSTEPDLFMINVNSSSQFYVGTYDPEAERMTVVGERQTLDSSHNYVYVWAAAGTQMISRAPTSRPTPGGCRPCTALSAPAVVIPAGESLDFRVLFDRRPVVEIFANRGRAPCTSRRHLFQRHAVDGDRVQRRPGTRGGDERECVRDRLRVGHRARQAITSLAGVNVNFNLHAVRKRG